MTTLNWTIELEGRRWTGDEVAAKVDALPAPIEVVEGRLLWSDDERFTLLAMLLEHCGARAAVRLGDPAIWRSAVAALDVDAAPIEPEPASPPPT